MCILNVIFYLMDQLKPWIYMKTNLKQFRCFSYKSSVWPKAHYLWFFSIISVCVPSLVRHKSCHAKLILLLMRYCCIFVFSFFSYSYVLCTIDFDLLLLIHNFHEPIYVFLWTLNLPVCFLSAGPNHLTSTPASNLILHSLLCI